MSWNFLRWRWCSSGSSKSDLGEYFDFLDHFLAGVLLYLHLKFRVLFVNLFLKNFSLYMDKNSIIDTIFISPLFYRFGPRGASAGSVIYKKHTFSPVILSEKQAQHQTNCKRNKTLIFE